MRAATRRPAWNNPAGGSNGEFDAAVLDSARVPARRLGVSISSIAFACEFGGALQSSPMRRASRLVSDEEVPVDTFAKGDFAAWADCIDAVAWCRLTHPVGTGPRAMERDVDMDRSLEPDRIHGLCSAGWSPPPRLEASETSGLDPPHSATRRGLERSGPVSSWRARALRRRGLRGATGSHRPVARPASPPCPGIDQSPYPGRSTRRWAKDVRAIRRGSFAGVADEGGHGGSVAGVARLPT